MTKPTTTGVCKKLGNLIWFLISWTLLLTAICAAVAGFYLYNRVDEEIRTHVEALLAQQYPDMHVTVRSARLLELEGFEIRGVSLAPRDPRDQNGVGGVGQPLAVADEVTVRCKPRLDELLRGQIEVEEIIIRRLAVRCTRQSDGGWTIQQLAKLPTLGGDSLPTLRLENSTLEIVDAFQKPQRIYTLRDMNAVLQPVGNQEVADATTQLRVEASASGDHLQRFTIQGTIEPQDGKWEFHGKQVHVDLSPTLRDALPVELSTHIGSLGPLVAKSDLSFDVAYDPQQDRPLSYSVYGGLRNGRLEDPRLPYPLTDVTAAFRCNHQTAVVDQVKARYGGATVELTIERDGHGSTESLVAHGSVKNFTLREDLVSRLAPEIQQNWKKFKPLGNLDADFAFTRRDGRWSPSIEVVCHDVSLSWESFRYPLNNTTGTISIRDAEMAFELRSRCTPSPVQIRGHVYDPGPRWRGWFEAQSEGPVPIDETLMAAGSQQMQGLVRPFSPRGNLEFVTRSERARGDQPVTKGATIRLVDCSIQHEQLPYPLNHVHGQLELINGHWKFSDLTGQNDTARIQAVGSWDKNREGGWLSLYFIGKNIPLEGELRNALPVGIQRTWENLRPRGTLDHLAARYDLAPKIGHSSIAVELEQWHRSRSATANGAVVSDSLSVTPHQFPYRIDDVSGKALYRDGQIQLTNLRGHHGPVQVSSNAQVTISPNGGWDLKFDDFHADRLRMDTELLAAAPPRLSRAISRMGLKGATSLDGRLQLSSTGPKAPVATQWDISVDLEDGSLGNRSRLEHIAGSARLIGEASETAVICRGDINIDSMTTRGVQIANVTSPFWFDGNRLLLGAWAQPTGSSTAARPLAARVFGGSLQADAQIMMDELGSFETSLRIEGANVTTVARDMKLPVTRVTGMANATLALRGNEQGRETWRGKGSVQMQNTDLYELPFVLSLLKSMRTGSTDRSAFDQVAVDFRIQGEHTYLDHVDLHGDTLTLKGAGGELNRQREITMDFYTIVGREKAYIDAVRPLLGMASRRFMLVKVRGPVNQPTMTREILPGLNETLQEWFPESEQPPRGGSIQRASYHLHPNGTGGR